MSGDHRGGYVGSAPKHPPKAPVGLPATVNTPNDQPQGQSNATQNQSS